MFKHVVKPALTSSFFLFSGIQISTNVLAEGDNRLDDNHLDQVIVTANRYTQSVDDSLASVTVITRDDIEKSPAQDLPSLLGRVAGFDIKPSGPYGKLTSMFLRGTESDHILTLVDGVKIYSASAGNTSFEHIPLNQIERIEIVRGPRSSLYGSEAIGGVVQIFTRKGSKQTSASTEIAAGSNRSREISANFSGATQKASFNLNARHYETDGIDAIKHNTENDDDGQTNNSISASFGYRFTPALHFQSSVLNAQGNTEYDDCYDSSFTPSDDCNSDFVQQTFSNTLNFTPSGIWDGELKFGKARDVNDNFVGTEANYAFETNRTDAAFINNLQFSETQLIILGLDYADDEVDSTSFDASAEPSRDNTGIFAGWNSQYNELKLNVNLRRDDNQQFDEFNTGSIELGHPVAEHIQATVSYGTGFKAPSFNDLYYPGYSDPTLVPEESSSTEIGLRGKYDTSSWSMNIYQTDIDNLIIPDEFFVSSNIAKSEITGAEFISELILAKWDINLSYSYTDAINKSGINNGKQLVFRAKQTLNLQAYRNFGKYGFGGAFLAQDKRYTSQDNSQSIAGYGLLDAGMDYALNKQMKLSAKINNLLDKDYVLNEDAFNTYNTLGRTFYVSLSYNM